MNFRMTAVVVCVAVMSGVSAMAMDERQNTSGSAARAPAGTAAPWTAAQTIQPAALVKALSDASKPTVVYVGFPVLFKAGHVPGALFHGPASTAAGLDDLKAWAQSQPKTSNIVIYCGCCPFDQCPNVHPAFTALRDMGFTHVRVLVLPKNFASDWVDRGYPVEGR